MTIRIAFDRATGLATFDGMTAHGTDPWREMCQALRDKGIPDDDAIMIDERGMPCLTVRSIHACARNHDRKCAKLAAFNARRRR